MDTTLIEVQDSVGGVDNPSDANNPGDEAVFSFGALGVPPGPFTITARAKRNMRAQCLVIPKQQGALIDIEEIEIEDESFELGSSVEVEQTGGAGVPTHGTPGTDFAEYGQCSNVVANACMTTNSPVSISGVNKSLTATDIQFTFRGTKLAKTDCPAPRGPNQR